MSAPFSAIPSDTVERQRRASRPQHSAWVSANAGSGKTHVLTQRVVRLLLEGVPPARILCLTFTKAAAANMSIRVFQTLARWATLDDHALATAVADTGALRPSPTDLGFARKLFARTVETPGGLKIQTIHAFCERLLHIFPFEANVAARFEVLDDLQRAELLEEARHGALDQAVSNPETALGHAVRFLADESSSFGFETLVGEALGHRETLALALGLVRTVDAFGAALGTALGLEAEDDLAAVERTMVEHGLHPTTWAEIAQTLGADGGVKDSIGNRLARAALAQGAALLDSYLDVFLTKDREPRADRYIVQALRKAHPDLCARLDAERDRLVALLGKHRAAQTVTRTLALVEVAKAVLDRYEAAKRRRGLLDFDDLVERTNTLLARSSAAWVLYKLDSGIDHVLIDEAQDTSPRQWDILRAITADFFSGAGQERTTRTVFAVGDEKQSIFSFQGAEPARFDAMKRAFALDVARGGGTFETVLLNLSFRSARAVLETVDRVFGTADHARGLVAGSALPPPHEALRNRTPGHVELWPAVGPLPHPEPSDWRLPVDLADPQSPPVIVAERIAATIAAMIAPGSGESVEDRAAGGRRRVRAGDILVLVRSRSAFFEAVIRALKDRRVPVAGADRLQLTDHIAVMDLIAAGRTALLPDDDLTLACVLKSPLIGLDDDDLIALAPHRRGSLAAALDRSETPRHRAAAARLTAWRKRAASLTPFAFYAQLLGADGGRRAMLARLGPEAGDALDEFLALTLAHERDGPPSLLRFLARLEGQDLAIKRDMDAAGDAVRVMTVHASKGLEAKIVFLPDTCGAPSGRHDPKLFAFEHRPDLRLLAWSPRSDADAPRVAAARDALRQAAMDEHRRLLYVALTRAEERLYIAGFHGTKGKADSCWYDMIAASDLGLGEVPAPWDASQQILRRRDEGMDGSTDESAAASTPPPSLPTWLTTRPAVEVTYAPPVKPSNALGAADQLPIEPDGFDAAPRDRRRRDAAILGRLAHQLLQHLPDLSPDHRAAAAQRFLAAHRGNVDPERLAAMADAVLRMIDDPALAALFGPGSRAEVGLAGRVTLGDGRTVDITGQVDRIAVTATSVLIADFKTGRPHGLDTVPPAYVAQLALYRAAVTPLYPGLVVRALLIWTTGPQVLELPSARLDAALGELLDAEGR